MASSNQRIAAESRSVGALRRRWSRLVSSANSYTSLADMRSRAWYHIGQLAAEWWGGELIGCKSLETLSWVNYFRVSVLNSGFSFSSLFLVASSLWVIVNIIGLR